MYSGPAYETARGRFTDRRAKLCRWEVVTRLEEDGISYRFCDALVYDT
jgi:hypothetical protein